jgi:hypothetical protein
MKNSLNADNIRKNLIVHPILFGIYPPVFLYLQNSGKLVFLEIAITILFVLVAVVMVWMVFGALTRDIRKSATITSSFFILIFSFGHFITAVGVVLVKYFGKDQSIAISLETRFWQSLLFIIWLLLFMTTSILTIKAKSSFFLVINKFFNLMAVGLVILAFLQYSKSLSYLTNLRIEAANISIETAKPQTFHPNALSKNVSNLPQLPHIYYIILDGYGRADVLTDLYQLDNSEFINFLRQKGFYVSHESKANYGMTLLSLSSSLNMIYLDGIAEQVGPNSLNQLPLLNLIRNNQTMNLLQENGYKTKAFASGYLATEIRNADEYLSPSLHLTGFQNVLMNTTPLKIFFLEKQYDNHRSNIFYTLDNLPYTADMTSPTFVFAHILSPHPPFIFDAYGDSIYPDRAFSLTDGNSTNTEVERRDYIENYRQQLIYITQEIEMTIERILDNSDIPPIIILQSDHGPGSELNWESLEDTNLDERMSILNAFYFPDQNYEQLYPSITPVNTFRVVLNKVLGFDIPLIEDKSYFSTMSHPYIFIEVIH